MGRLAELYFRPKPFERDGRLYVWLGIAAFKRGLMALVEVDPGRNVENAYVLGGTSVEHVRAFERRSRRSELIHLFGLAIGVLLLGLAALRDGGLGVVVAGVVLFAVNFPCFALQRYNRARVYRVLERARRG